MISLKYEYNVVDFWVDINHWCPVKNQRFFATLRMTTSYSTGEGDGVGSGSATSNPIPLII